MRLGSGPGAPELRLPRPNELLDFRRFDQQTASAELYANGRTQGNRETQPLATPMRSLKIHRLGFFSHRVAVRWTMQENLYEKTIATHRR